VCISIGGFGRGQLTINEKNFDIRIDIVSKLVANALIAGRVDSEKIKKF